MEHSREYFLVAWHDCKNCLDDDLPDYEVRLEDAAETYLEDLPDEVQEKIKNIDDLHRYALEQEEVEYGS